MSTNPTLQQSKELLWATPAPILAMIDSQMVRLIVKGRCSLQVTDAGRLAQVAPDERAFASQGRAILANGVTDVIASQSRSVSSVDQLAAMKGEIASALQEQVADQFQEMGLEVKTIQLDSLEGG